MSPNNKKIKWVIISTSLVTFSEQNGPLRLEERAVGHPDGLKAREIVITT